MRGHTWWRQEIANRCLTGPSSEKGNDVKNPLVVLLATLIVKTPPVGLQSVGQISPTMAFREEDPDESAQRQIRLSLPDSRIQARRQVERLQAVTC